MRYSFGNADPQALDAAFQQLLIIGHGDIDAGGILGIDAGHGLQHDGGVPDRLGHGPGLIQRRGKGDDAETRAAAISRLQPDPAGDGGGLADGAAGVGAGGGQAEIGGNGGGRTAGRTARHQIGVGVSWPARD